jgi:hypothetical protein
VQLKDLDWRPVGTEKQGTPLIAIGLALAMCHRHGFSRSSAAG